MRISKSVNWGHAERKQILLQNLMDPPQVCRKTWNLKIYIQIGTFNPPKQNRCLNKSRQCSCSFFLCWWWAWWGEENLALLGDPQVGMLKAMWDESGKGGGASVGLLGTTLGKLLSVAMVGWGGVGWKKLHKVLQWWQWWKVTWEVGRERKK